MLRSVPDWRWGLHGRATPWYPAARLYRQRAPGDWEPVIAALARDLATLAADQGSAAAGHATSGSLAIA